MPKLLAAYVNRVDTVLIIDFAHLAIVVRSTARICGIPWAAEGCPKPGAAAAVQQQVTGQQLF